MKRSKSQAVYKILPKMWISDKDSKGNNITAQVKSWNYRPMEGIYSNFIESEIKRQVKLFSMHGGDISDYNLSDENGGISVVRSACIEGIADIIAELSPLLYYCPDCHRITQFQNIEKVMQICPACKKGLLKQLQLVYPCECGYATPIYVPKDKEYYYFPVEKQYGVFYYQGNTRLFKEFKLQCPNCKQWIQRDSATAGSNYKAFTANVINLISPKLGEFYQKGEPARKIMISKWFGIVSENKFANILEDLDTAFNKKNTKLEIDSEALKQAETLLKLGLIAEDKFNEIVVSLSESSSRNESSIERYVAACDEMFAKEKKESNEDYNLWVNNFAFNLMQYETIKKSKGEKSIISFNEIKEKQKDDEQEINQLHEQLGIKNVQATCDVEIISCSYGFTRKLTDPHNAKRTLKLVAYDKDGSSNKNLAYGTKLETEGILFDIDHIKILKWLIVNKVISEEQLPDLEDDVAVKKWFAINVHGDRIGSFGYIDDNEIITKNVFTLLHSISHALIKTAGEMSGLSSNSITELIFVDTCSIFIYSQSNQGQVLGSLSGMIESLYVRFLKLLYQDNRECVFDPICIDRDNSVCHGCLVIADNSCKFFNTNLGRKYLYSFQLDEEKRIGFWEM